MCLIAISWAVDPRYPLALIANRDEFHARPTATAGPDPGYPDVYGGRDLLQGGSWLLVSTRGRLAAVTNVRVGRGAEPAPRSRGALVRDFVTGDESAEAWLDKLSADAAEFGRFNLLAWDGTSLRFASNHPHYATKAVAPGVHAMSNGAFDAAWPKSARATQALSSWLGVTALGEPDPADLFDALADTTPAPDDALPDTGVGLELERALSPPFVRSPAYGTRCSSVVLVAAEAISFVERRFGPEGQVSGQTDVVLDRN